ncbi:hypothetical protein PROFUN_11245 [Planoprotostelium fungivorum]|uniref:Glycerol-3-phosphate dehydrogenase [NAD(+)] n=1 Tax=Planoprotostelium fungivorum TaxID=1890364 RepID=A0A2P6NA64_9EUKA|nr:hypothetical protein PROFUN_11245 [Planoprotostelium fungivorum]
MSQQREKVAIIGGGSFGTAVAKIIGQNVLLHDDIFEPEVLLRMTDSTYNGEKLIEIFNRTHENPKYQPGITLPSNIIATSDLEETVKDATILVFVLPHQFLEDTCYKMKQFLKEGTKAISLVKGVNLNQEGPVLLSTTIVDILGIDVSVLMGANIASEIAKDQFSEATIGYTNEDNANLFVTLFHTPKFMCTPINDVPGVELCGALKNVIAIAAGFSDGLGLPGNSKAAILRIGLLEMKKFAQHFFPEVKTDTFFESCGIADLYVTCTEGRNRKCAEAFAKTGKSFKELEAEMLNGQLLQGTGTTEEVYKVLDNMNMTKEFPLMSAVHDIAFEGKPVTELVSSLEVN